MFFLLMCVVVFLLWRTVKMMPRVKPTEITPGSSSSVTWAEVAGLDEAKEELQEVVDFLRDPKSFERLGARVPKGILLHGPPGTGKTLAAKAVANESGARFFAQSASAFVEMFAGLGAARIRKLFEDARKNAPSIVFIDELDAVGRTRSGHSFNREQDQTLNQLLVELDGFGPRDQVVVMAASNRLQDLDPALLRPAASTARSCAAPRSQGPARDPRRAHARQAARTRHRPRVDRPPDGRPDRRRPREHLQRGGDRRRPRTADLIQVDFDCAMDRVIAGPPAAPRRSPTRRSGSSPTTKVATRSWRI